MIPGSREWYYEKSEQVSGQPLRCPFAAANRCPRHFESLDLVEHIGGCAIEPQMRTRFKAKWKDDLIVSPVPEMSTSVMGAGDGRFSMLNNFCPEVTYNNLGWFASEMATYADEIDRDAAHVWLRRHAVSIHDPRWRWSVMIPLHYRECSIYALLSSSEQPKPDHIIGLKPGMWALQLT